jgi:hypothetical protein
MRKIVTERSNDNGTRTVPTESVADILERALDPVIHDWMRLVEKQEDLMSIALSYEDRTGHLPALLREVIARLRLDAGTKAPISVAASHHGDLRRNRAIRWRWWSRSHASCRFVFSPPCTKTRT